MNRCRLLFGGVGIRFFFVYFFRRFMLRQIRVIGLWLCCILFVEIAYASDSELFLVKGKVKSEGEPVPFAYVAIEELNIAAICDANGQFSLMKVPRGKHTLQVSCLGYASRSKVLEVSGNTEVTVSLLLSTLNLPEFEVMAKQKSTEKISVNEMAIEYTQPTSLADVLLLLPGNVYQENGMSSFSQISSRQVGTDANSSLGVALVTDGAPATNDGMRTQMVGVTASSSDTDKGDSELKSRTGINQGADLRYISTDHIQSVDFTQGISSARYGNLSSGVIQVNSKYGVSPWNIRMKADLKNKLIYLGKGTKLSDKAGSLHLGVDYLHSIDDVREEMDKFSRLTGQAYYNNVFHCLGRRTSLDMRLSQTITTNKMKKDELTYEYDETYKANYSKTGFMLKSKMELGSKWMDWLEFISSIDLTNDRVERHKMVLSSSGPLSVPLATEEGEHEGLYLPGKYYSDFYVENIPLNTFLQLNAASGVAFGKNTNAELQYGAEFASSKNWGEGAVIQDPQRPPFPYDNTYMRPRPNWAIPALENGALYLQSELRRNFSGSRLLKLSLGGRATKMFNLDRSYELSKRCLLEPRANASFKFGKRFSNTFRVGYGEENKLPTLDYLYPEKLYKDFYMLNAYTNNPDYRHLITYTNIFEVENKAIRENKNRKMEVGWNGEWSGYALFLTGFYERSTSGFDYFLVYSPLDYDLYSTLLPDADISNRVPQKEDYQKEHYQIFTTSLRVMNSKKTEKRGVEYRLVIPKIHLIQTSIEINGAYYRTNYGSSLPTYSYPNKRIADRPYPYVGIYDMDEQNKYRRFNSNFWFNTHIPRLKLMFTNFVQVVWLNTTQYKDSHLRYPTSYLDLDGVEHETTQQEIDLIEEGDAVFRHLKRTTLPIDYEEDSKPISLLWNFKASKELSKLAKVSFFVNGILDVSPKYTSGKKTTKRKWSDPYFGMEMQLSLGK